MPSQVQPLCHCPDPGGGPVEPTPYSTRNQTVNFVAIPVESIKEKCLQVSVSAGMFVCHLANKIERD